MLRYILFGVVIAGCTSSAQKGTPVSVKQIHYPETRIEPIKEQLHGVEVADPYRWLEDDKSTEVKNWMSAQDSVARAELAQLAGRDKLIDRLRALFYVDSISVPLHRGGRYFYKRTFATKEKGIVYVREGEAGVEKVLLDPNTMSADGTTSIGEWMPSHDGKKVAYTLHANNSDEATLYVIDVDTITPSKVDVIEGAKYASPAWTPKGDGFYYTFLPSGPNITVADRPGFAEVRFHKLGTSPQSDTLIHPRTGSAETFIAPQLSHDGRWLFVYIQHGWNASDVYYRDLSSSDKNWKTLVAGKQALFEIEAYKNRFYVRTNDGAPKWKMVEVDPAHPQLENWRPLVAESADAVLDGSAIIGDRFVLSYLKNAVTELAIHHLDGKLDHFVKLPGIGAVTQVAGEPEDTAAYFDFASFTQPRQVWKLPLAQGCTAKCGDGNETELWAEIKLPIDATPYAVEQVWYPSKDGTKISMFIVHRKDMPKNGTTPFLLTGYGGFNVSMQPAFSAGLYPWLEAGGGFALPNLRGGGEYGEAWHQAGMQANKQNVFDDFIGAAEYLVKQGYTQPARLAIRGRSNGGLLMGASMTQRPDLFRAVICGVPLLDMVRYPLFGSGKTWVPEYGSPDDGAQFKTLYAYSPYHHVKADVKYPSLLMTSADADDRVDPMHARKMVAAVQAATTSGLPVLLRIEKHSGHGGADLVKQAVEMAADEYAFIIHELGMSVH